MATDTKTAPDLDALERLLEETVELLAEVRPRDCGAHYCRYCSAKSPEWAHDLHCPYVESQQAAERASLLRKRLVDALPALLATARRARRLREALEYIKPSLPVLATMCQTAGFMLAEAKARDMVATVDAALAEEGQDG